MLPFVSAAQTYPSKIIRVINPAAPGGNSDLFFRVLSPKMNEALGQQLVMDYRPGAGATVGTEVVARSAPDGYTVLITAASHVTNPALVNARRQAAFVGAGRRYAFRGRAQHANLVGSGPARLCSAQRLQLAGACEFAAPHRR